jgi:hypothetical protein
MLKNFKKEFNKYDGVKLTPGKLSTFCEIDWPTFGVGWPSEGSLDKIIVNRVFEVIIGEPGHQISFLILAADECSPQLAHMAKAPPRGSTKGNGSQ